MATWEKKIRSGGGNDLHPSEELLGGALLNPPGTTGGMVARNVGGLLGGALHSKFGAREGDAAALDSDSGIAASIPDKPVWIAVTPTRVLVWGHSTMSGKPKGLELTLARGDVARVEVEKLKTSYATTVHFADGTAKLFEAPKMMNDPVGFAAAVNAT